MNSFEGKNMQTQYKFLSYRIDLYFHDYKLAVEMDENGHINRNTKSDRIRTWLQVF